MKASKHGALRGFNAAQGDLESLILGIYTQLGRLRDGELVRTAGPRILRMPTPQFHHAACHLRRGGTGDGKIDI